MTNEEPNLDLSDAEEKDRFPWLIIVGVVLLTAIVAAWMIRANSRQEAVTSALQKEMTAEKAVLDQERDKVFDLTRELETLKQQVNAGQVADKAQAIARYNALAAEQRTQREKVKGLADAYNQKVAKMHELQ